MIPQQRGPAVGFQRAICKEQFILFSVTDWRAVGKEVRTKCAIVFDFHIQAELPTAARLRVSDEEKEEMRYIMKDMDMRIRHLSFCL